MLRLPADDGVVVRWRAPADGGPPEQPEGLWAMPEAEIEMLDALAGLDEDARLLEEPRGDGIIGHGSLRLPR